MYRPKSLQISLLVLFLSFASVALGSDWPSYLHDINCSGVTADVLADTLTQQWVFQPTYAPAQGWGDAETLSAIRHDDSYPVAAVGNYVYFAASGENKIYCINAVNGTIGWVAFTEGPCRQAPTVVGTKLYAGCDDGCVYCLNTSDGSQAWKFNANPEARKCIGETRMSSVWPIRTGVLVDSGKAYFGAGIYANEGIYFFCIDATTGAQVYKTSCGTNNGGNITAQGYLTANSSKVFMPSGRIGPVAFDRASGSLSFKITAGCGATGGDYCMLNGNYLYNGNQTLTAYTASSGGSSGYSWSGRYAAISGGSQYIATGSSVVARTESSPGSGNFNTTTWTKTDNSTADSIIVAGDKVYAGGVNKVCAWRADGTGALVWSATVDGTARALAAANGHLFVSTTTGKVYCFGSGGSNVTITPPGPANPFPTDSLTPYYSATADAIVNGSGITSGFALIIGGGNGRLAYELANRTSLYIVVIDSDAAKTANGKLALHNAGLYGGRVIIDTAAMATFAYPSYFANLVVSEEGFFGATVSTPNASELSRVIRPCGGVAYVGQPTTWTAAYGGTTLNSSAVQSWTTGLHPSCSVTFTSSWAKVSRGSLPGAADWTHQNATPANNNNSEDFLAKGPFKTLWFGQPSSHDMIERHARAPAPLVMNGRMYYEGNNVVMAYDAYNGQFLWKKTISGAYCEQEQWNCSNVALSSSGLYIAVGSNCYKLDLLTGNTLQTFTVPAGSHGTRRWGWLAIVGNTLYGSRLNSNNGFNGYPGPDWGFEEPMNNDSEAVFALDATTGAQKWIYNSYYDDYTNNTANTAGKNPYFHWQPRPGITNASIVVADNKVFFVDNTTNPSVMDPQAAAERTTEGMPTTDRLGNAIVSRPKLMVALDANTGATVWTRVRDMADCLVIPLDSKDSCCGDVTLMYEAYNGVKYLVLCGSPYHEDHELSSYQSGDFDRRSIAVFDATTGTKIWSGGKKYQTKPLIINGMIYAEPSFWNLATGQAVQLNSQPWQYYRGYSGGCGSFSASATNIFSRGNGSTFNGTAFYDINSPATGMQDAISNQRPSCLMSYVPADGVLVMPEGGAQCTCPYAVQGSTVMYNPNAQGPQPLVYFHVFYNNSAFDGNNAAANSADDAAIATDKQAIIPGSSTTATAANYTSYSKGINGIMVDIANLPGTPTASDFEFRTGNSSTPSSWTLLGGTKTVSVRKGAGTNQFDRITIILHDGAVVGTWLQVRVKASANTGLTMDRYFVIGNAPGETGNSLASARVDSADVLMVRSDPHKTFANPAPITDMCDFNRDKVVNSADEIIGRSNMTTVITQLNLITPQ